MKSNILKFEVLKEEITAENVLEMSEVIVFAQTRFLIGYKGYSLEYIGQVIENIVFNEIRRRGYNAYVGKLGEREVDFIAENAGEKVYIQVAYSVASKETMSREVNSLLEIRDAYPKYVVSMDALSGGNKDGIRFIYLADFLLKKEW